MKLILIRHPQTVALENRIIYGSTDSPLTARGEASIEWVSERLAQEDIAAIYCSPLQRTRVLAEGIAARHPGLIPAADARIRELDCGKYEQLSFEEAIALDKEDATKFLYEFGEHRPEGGENFEDVKARTGPFLEDLARFGKEKELGDRPITVVSHAMAIRSMISHLFGYQLRDIWHIEISPSVILWIEYDPERKFGRLTRLECPEF